MEKLRAGVIGLGMGRGHVAGYQEHPNAEVVAVADLDEDRLDQVGAEFAVENLYPSGEVMLDQEDLDVVSVATPNKFHKPLTIQAFEEGCHVLCEKPMAMNAEQGREMISASENAGKRLMINFSFRFNEVAQALKSQVDAGTLGDVYFARTIWLRRRGMPGFGGWFGQKELAGGGPLIDLGVHRIDLALWLMGYPQPSWVLGSTYDYLASTAAEEEGKKFDVEDLAVALIKFDNGATLEAEASWAAHIGENELMETRVLGTEGGLIYQNVGEGYDFEAKVHTTEGGYQYDKTLHQTGAGVHSSMYHFVDCIVNDQPHIATGEEGLIVMELLDSIYRSAADGEPVLIGG
ncbi:MAG: Gfo/Idh/MocA family protein [Candidatus Brocadiia bacterium]